MREGVALGMPGGSAKRGRRPQAGGAGGAKPQEAVRLSTDAGRNYRLT